MKRTLVLVLFLVACGSPAPVPSPSSSASSLPTPPPPPPTTCSSPPPVYHPSRLAIINACKQYQGVVIAVLREADGDHHLWISPDPGFEGFLNSSNVLHGQKALVAEIVPACVTPPANSSAAAHCPPSQLPEPHVGDHVSVSGPWVTDTVHGWNEIHPVTAIQQLPKSSRHLVYPSPEAIDVINDE